MKALLPFLVKAMAVLYLVFVVLLLACFIPFFVVVGKVTETKAQETIKPPQ